ncbi:hypothetical protein [Clostridium saccharobutylicum]|uniref:Uncharacterized protein n=1 Tax=Clostridium saccharobutylicum DSM 13864 TaxID=1345695 RepID=U5MSN9_CLOSA|nr:hypothetical protein [Clostridium saccharobutylicum]AGX42422.1 hypothetical protein CLSA_c14200 [Clostridium saccharobutylicum DSM 13864]AQR89706.1 hypothetical protein CLOSC_14090 [Clostridium saccharobutylicum]AQR99608.1 hypothetical protein CSACC_14170 [Clostridium saccharobutylicum]AQS09338.1 hypothetical protein CLOBY_14650 [Clostridium saccharobutylicum]AQS13594.1 hypothetical protein CLOSACC_14170 [Clostridium saccharobutylicum]
MDNASLNYKDLTFKEIEQKIYKYACDEACNTMREVLEWLDKNCLMKEIIRSIEIMDLREYV